MSWRWGYFAVRTCSPGINPQVTPRRTHQNLSWVREPASVSARNTGARGARLRAMLFLRGWRWGMHRAIFGGKAKLALP